MAAVLQPDMSTWREVDEEFCWTEQILTIQNSLSSCNIYLLYLILSKIYLNYTQINYNDKQLKVFIQYSILVHTSIYRATAKIQTVCGKL